METFRGRARGLKMPAEVEKVSEEEISNLGGLEQGGEPGERDQEFVEWLTQIPLGQHSSENLTMIHSRQTLDEDHYGLKDVQDRILEFLAVGKLRGSVQGKIILLASPLGVGKTSIGKSIARALGRQFFRFSVGVLTDVAEIKGHRKTYVGALPGKIIQAF